MYHLSMSSVSRAKGGSACASLAYITGKKIHDDRTGCDRDYSRKERVIHSNTLLPPGAPAKYFDPEKMFNAIEKTLTDSDAITAKKVEIALPRELSLAQQIALVEKYIQEKLLSAGYAATYAIHTDPDGRNPHSHILIPSRQIGPKGAWISATKTAFALDEHGQKIPVIDPATGQQKLRRRKGKGAEKVWKRINIEQNPIIAKNFLLDLRASWADHVNAALRAIGSSKRVDHRSNRARGIAALATIHEGRAAREMEKRGEISERCEENRRRRALNAEAERAARELVRIRSQRAQLAATAKAMQPPQATSPTLARGQAQPPPMHAAHWAVLGSAAQQSRSREAVRSRQEPPIAGHETPAPRTEARMPAPASAPVPASAPAPAATDEQRKRQRRLLRWLVARELHAGGSRAQALKKYGPAMQALGMDPKKTLAHAVTELRMRRSGAWSRPHTRGWPDVLSRIPPKLRDGDPLPPHLPPGALESVDRAEGDTALLDRMRRDELRHQRSVRDEL